MTSHLTTLLLVAGCWLLAGCALVPEFSRQNPGSYDGGKSDSWTGQKPAPWPPTPKPQAMMKAAAAPQIAAAYDSMAPTSYPPMGYALPPAPLPQCPPLHWEASPGWGGLVISGPALETLDWNHTGCPQYPKICTALAWLTETTDYVLSVQKTGIEFARIIPFETE